jgi:hypothetical protein
MTNAQTGARIAGEATATVASIRTRLGQIEKACANWTADSVYQIERAAGALRIAAIDLENALRGDWATKARPISEYHEDMGPVLWWKFPVDEPPYVGGPLDNGKIVEICARYDGGDKLMLCQVGGWPGYHTHWTPLPAAPEGEG